MKYLLLLLLSLTFYSCVEEEEEEERTTSTPEYRTCIGGNTCIDYQTTGLTATQVQQACSDAGSTASADSCPTAYNGSASTGVCEVTTSSNFSLGYRFYYGTVDAPEPATEQTACTAIGAQDGNTSSWNADSLALSGKSTFYCRFQEKCQRVDNFTEDEALSYCDERFGYLDLNCD